MNNDHTLAEFELEAPTHFPARIVRGATDATVADLLRRAKEFMRADGSDLADEDIFTWSAIISNQNLDSYFTRMADSSLQNYAEDAKSGVAFLNSHRQYELPTGYSIGGEFRAGEIPEVLADFYTVRGIQLNAGLPTDNFIKGVQAGLIRDVSIGFKDGPGFEYSCSICGLDMWDWDCWHIPGAKYSVIENPDAEPDDQVEREDLCFAWIKNARLSEVSAVYDGATPGAMVVKATRELRAGRLRPETQRMLETAYRINLPKGRILVPVGDTEREENMDKEKTSGAPDKGTVSAETVRALNMEARFAAKSVGVTVDADADAGTVVEALRGEIERLQPFERQAEEGRKLRILLVADAVKEGIRAFGADFDAEARATALNSMDIDTVSELRGSWKGIADANLPNKRVSEDTPEGTDGEGEGKGEGDSTDGEGGEDRSTGRSKRTFIDPAHLPAEGYGGV